MRRLGKIGGGPAAGTAGMAAVLPLLLHPGPARAHGGEALDAATAWSDWHFAPEIAIPLSLAALLYLAGLWRRSDSARNRPWWRHLLFLLGLGALAAALLSPIDPVAERLFYIHQVQHLLLRMLAPMLLALSWPEGLFSAGLPRPLRRGLAAPLLRSGGLRRGFAILAHPAVATAIFIAALYFWEIPRFHDLAIRNDAVHDLMHVTMLLAGLLFWWRVFDRRPAPQGLGYGVRLMMLWLAILSNILLGAYTTLKGSVLYPAYDALGRLYGLAALTDEQYGGIVIWIPSSMMCLIAVLVVIHLWGRHETRQDRKRQAALESGSNSAAVPTTGAGLYAERRARNRSLGLGFAAFALAVFTSAILVGLSSSLLG